MDKCKRCLYYDFTRIRRGRKVHICKSPRLEPDTIYDRIIYERIDKCPEK